MMESKSPVKWIIDHDVKPYAWWAYRVDAEEKLVGDTIDAYRKSTLVKEIQAITAAEKKA